MYLKVSYLIVFKTFGFLFGTSLSGKETLRKKRRKENLTKSVLWWNRWQTSENKITKIATNKIFLPINDRLVS